MGSLTMLDGERYYATFPDEKPEERLRGLLDALTKLQEEFRKHIEAFKGARASNAD
jgi:hypothetical protein